MRHVFTRTLARPGRGASVVLLTGTLLLGACSGEKTFYPPDREAQVEQADARITPQTFDTISWASDQARGLAGNVTYSAKCRTCHGPQGAGNTAYANDRGLDVPSLVEPDWRWADSLSAVRRRVFVGHAQGMPTWGVAGITPREIDGVAYFVLEVLRSPDPASP